MKSTLRIALTTFAFVALFTPSPAAAAVCSDFPDQASAQAAANTTDADGDGIYCETLPCPCATPGPPAEPPAPIVPPPPIAPAPPPAVAPVEPGPTVPSSGACVRPKLVQSLRFSANKYPNIRRHYLSATAKGWPRIMVLNRTGAAERRARLLRDSMTRPGFDRDEYPAAIGRGRANGASRSLLRGTNPVGWMADVRYVPTSENRSHGASLGGKLRRFCNGTRFRYIFT